MHHSSSRSPGLAAVLAFLWPGLGHLYAGRIGRGFAFMFAPVAVALVFLTGLSASHRAGEPLDDGKLAGWLVIALVRSVVIYVWQIADAYGCVQSEGSPARRRRRH